MQYGDSHAVDQCREDPIGDNSSVSVDERGLAFLLQPEDEGRYNADHRQGEIAELGKVDQHRPGFFVGRDLAHAFFKLLATLFAEIFAELLPKPFAKPAARPLASLIAGRLPSA